jgi:hypothetical protein
MIKRVPISECHVEVNPRSAGDFGAFRMSGIYRTPDEERRYCENISVTLSATSME